MRPTQQLHDLGQSFWLYNITRGLLTNGTLQRYISEFSITGLTSNPSIFDHAIKNSNFYDDAIQQKLKEGKTGEALFFELALKRFLIERLWPRGIKKENLKIDGWIKEAGPSTELRKWFSHDPAKWDRFRERNFMELDRNRPVLKPILEASQTGTVTLIYSSHDTEHNNAVALAEYLKKKASGS